MPKWKLRAQERLAKKNLPAEAAGNGFGASTRGGSDRGNPRAQTFTQDELYADAIPDVNPRDELPKVHKVSDAEVERILDTTPYEQQYRLFGKGDMPQYDAARGEHRMRCPFPWHTDEHASGSFRVDENGKDVYNCFKCGGGDIFSIAAAHYGMSADGGDLPYIKRKLAAQLSGAQVEDYGAHEVLATPAVREVIELQAKKEQDESKSELEEMRLRLIKNEEVEPVEPEQAEATEAEDFLEAVPEFDTIVPEPLPTPESTPPSSQTELSWPLDQEPPDVDNYEKMLESGTFLSNYFTACSADRYPNDFHFFHGLLAVGYAAGRDVAYSDDPVVYGNMYVCFVSGTGTGKTNSRHWLYKVLAKAMPYDELDHLRSGVNRLAEVASGETLIDSMMSKEIPYPNRQPGEPASTKGRVKGFVDLDELETFMSKAAGKTSTLRPILTSMYSSNEVSTRSRGSGTSIASEPFLSLTANVPPESLRELMTSNDAFSGFLNRFTFVTAKPEKEQRFKNKKVDFDADALSLQLRELLAWCQVRREITMSPEAEELLEEFFRIEISTVVPLVREDADSMLARLDLFIKKYLLLFAVNEMKDVIDIPIAEKAIRLYWISKRNLQVVGVKVKMSASSELEDIILDKIKSHFKKNAEPLTVGEINGNKCQIRAKLKALGLERKDLDIAIKNLVGSGDLVEVRGDKADKRVKPKYIPHID